MRKVSFLFAVKALSRRFRTLFCNAVRAAYADGSLHISIEIVADAQALDLLIAHSYKTDWHAYAKPPFGGHGSLHAGGPDRAAPQLARVGVAPIMT